MDTDMFEDDKIRLVKAEFGASGVTVYVLLLCKIYRNGWFYRWGEDECLLLTEQLGAGFVPSKVDEIVKGLVRRSLFDKGVLDRFHALTSAGIQRRYIMAARQMGRSVTDCITDPELWLLPGAENLQKNRHGPGGNDPKNDNSEIIGNNSEIKYTKEKKRKEKKEREPARAQEDFPKNENLNATFMARLRSDQMKLQSIGAACSITEQEVLSMLDGYARWLEVGERRKLTYGEYCGTFMTWIQYELKQQSNKNGTNKNGHGAIDIGANRPEDYRAKI